MDLVIRRQSEQIHNKPEHPQSDIFYDRKWEWGFLRKQCWNLELEPFYNTYTQRLQRSYLSIFIVIQALVGIIHSIILAAFESNSSMFPELLLYLLAVMIIWMSLFITFREDLIKRRQWIAYVASFIAIFTLVIVDLSIPLYHAMTTFPIPALRPTYGSYILYAVYIFVPLSENWHAFILGIAVTICYILEFMLVTYRLDDHIFVKTGTEAVFLIFINLFGMYFRLMKEIAIRTTFLDRRQCVEENLLLKHARDQERRLLLNILPAHIADKLENDVRFMFKKLKCEKSFGTEPVMPVVSPQHSHGLIKWGQDPINTLNVEEHKDVSVLYADVVNYTYLTTQLDVKPLVETLHELFVKFDQASEEYNVLRIKFLGDCYYCVSGVPERNLYHAKSCVDLGLRMIKDIREVRSKRKLDIDMRIGVHSGSILSGVIGACKWQYDVWSKDVDIANRMESTGMAGRVHITKQTLRLLEDEYLYEPGTDKAKLDPVLQKYGIETYLIVPPHSFSDHRCYQEEGQHRQSVGVRRILEQSRRSKPIDLVPKNFMQNTIEEYSQIRAKAKLEMGHELDKMPIGKFHLSKLCLGSTKRLTQDELEEQNFRSNVSTFFLFFKEARWEFQFLVEPDIMLKYSTLIALITFFGIFLVQGMNNPSGIIFWTVNGITAIILTTFIPLTWFKKLWIVFTPPSDDDTDDSGLPKNKLTKFLYKISHNVMKSIISRTIIYLTIVGLLCVCSLLHLLECGKEKIALEMAAGKNITVHFDEHRLCSQPWAITESLILTLCMSFLFVRIPFLFKFFIGGIIVLAYALLVVLEYPFVYNGSSTTNYGLDPKFAHIFVIVFTFFIFHMVDRQTEYIAKVDYNWKQQLNKKHEDAEFTKETNKVLVHNLLPAHVAEIYISQKMKDELYYEKYENVAIMFATIKDCDFEDENLVNGKKTVLSILNSIICDFDEILMRCNGPLKIEKIKVAGWTYMAACGLDPGRCDSTTSLTGLRGTGLQRSSAILSTVSGRRSGHCNGHSTTRRYSLDEGNSNNRSGAGNRVKKMSSKQSHNVVYVLTEFALQLMKSLQNFNNENFQMGTLRIGISHGEIMAGVVGSSKPLYDVWGNAVNMASRMDTTGEPGKIQVTADTAEVLKTFGINCQFRGLTYVKGRTNRIPTYFVDTDENFNFKKDLTDYSNNEIFKEDTPSNTKL